MTALARKRTRLILTAAVLLSSVACRPPETRRADGGCPDVPEPALELPALDLASPGVSQANLRTWIDLLTSPALEGRHAGEPGAWAVADLLARQLAAFGLEPPAEGACQAFPFFDGEDYNVTASYRSGTVLSDPGDGRPLILVSAHYDGQGKHPAGMIYPGADDNASGIAALLELARLTDPGDDSRVGWVFTAFGAEEAGRMGSHAYIRHPPLDLSGVALAVNLDMVGRPLPGEAPDAIGYLTSPDDTSALVRRAAEIAGVDARDLDSFGKLRPMISDADVLAERLPTVLLSTALHKDHHQLSDVPERVEIAQVERAVHLVLALADILTGRS